MTGIAVTKWKASRWRDVATCITTSMAKCLTKGMCVSLWCLTDTMPPRAGWLVRYGILRRLSHRCGQRVYIGRHCEIRNWENLEIGDDVSIHSTCYLDAKGGISIGNQVSIAHHTSILSADHTWSDPSLPIRSNPVTTRQTRICDDTWIGCGCRILAGVTIGSRSVVAAGSVVTRDVNAGTLVAGVPARSLKQIGVSADTKYLKHADIGDQNTI